MGEVIWTVVWLILCCLILGFFIGMKVSEYKKIEWWQAVSWIVALALAICAVFSAVGNFWRKRVKQYDEGIMVKEVTYNIKKVNGNIEQADSTFTFVLKE